MFASISFPDNLEPEELDNLLANGWYRMGQSVFTTHFLCFKNCFYSAVWLRVGLADLIEDDKFGQLKKQNRFFRIEIKKALITPQHEELYKNYRQSVSFDPSETIQTLLYGYASVNRFNTYEINVYDDKLLIASGYFDLGNNSATGIVSFYHPGYKKYSLGKYLIYNKIDYCRQQNIAYFYPGYVVPGYPSFDYKTTIGKQTLEYYSIVSKQWLPYKNFTQETNPLKIMCNKLHALQQMLNKKNYNNRMLFYRFFDANLDPYYSLEKLFDFPVFIYCEQLIKNDNFKLIVYDISNENYCLVQCSVVIKTDWYKGVDEIFSSYLLKTSRLLFTTTKPDELVNMLF